MLDTYTEPDFTPQTALSMAYDDAQPNSSSQSCTALLVCAHVNDLIQLVVSHRPHA